MKSLILGAVLVMSAVVLSFACTKSETSSSTSAASASDPAAAQIEKGRSVYQSVCIACHNTDPRKPGSLGPDVWGSSRELIEARVMRAEYPTGYTPKRSTHAMVALPQYKYALDAIHAYLNK